MYLSDVLRMFFCLFDFKLTHKQSLLTRSLIIVFLIYMKIQFNIQYIYSRHRE